MPRHVTSPSRLTALAAVVLGLTACGSAAPTPAPTPSAIPIRAVGACPASVVVPTATLGAAPDAVAPPTVIVPVGGAVSFTVPAGARFGLSGDPDPADDAQVCAARPDASGDVVWVAQAEGYLRVAVQIGIASPTRFFLRVTG